MKKYPNLVLGLMLAICLIAGAAHGRYVTRLRESSMFYRWLESAATQSRLFGNMDNPGAAIDRNYRDGELFHSVDQLMEQTLPDIPLLDDDYDEDTGKPHSKFVRFVKHGEYQDQLWNLAKSAQLAELRETFLRMARDHELMTLGTQFGLEDMYASEEGTLVNIANLFFGFRKMAANLVWLEVDKFWHSGMMHRMIPLMKVAVALDPNFVDAYLLGAWHLAYNATASLAPTPEALKEYEPAYGEWVGPKERYYYEAIEFLKDGIRKNPTNYKVYFDLGFAVYEEKLEDHKNAVKYLSEAVRHRHERWVRSTLYRSLQRNGQYEEALAGWKDYRAQFPGTTRAENIAPRFIAHNEGLILERDGFTLLDKAHKLEEQAAQARAQGDLAAAGQIELEAKAAREAGTKKLDEATAVWERCLQPSSESDGADGFAQARLMRVRAMKLAEEKRYYEALAVLENARWASNEEFYDLSDQIIRIKKIAGIRLSETEEMSERRKAEDEAIREQRRQMRERGELPG